MGEARRRFSAFWQCGQASSRSVLRGSFVIGVAAVVAGCFVAPPPSPESIDDTGGESLACVAGERGCSCYPNASCDPGFDCDAWVWLCVPMQCEPGTLACSCAQDGCIWPHVCAEGLCTEDDDSAETTATPTSAPTSTDDSGTTSSEDSSSGAALDTTTSDAGERGAETSGDASSGGGDCTDMACAACVECVDDATCAEEFEACDAVNGCATAVECLVECGLGIDCLDPCCNGLTATQLAAVDALILCKSDECLDPCSGQAEFGPCA